MQPCHEIENLRLDVIHVGPLGDLDPVVPDRAPLELGERLLDLLAHVRLTLVPVHPDAIAPDVHRVTNGGQRLHHRLRFGAERSELVPIVVVRHIIAQTDEAV